MKVTLCIQPAAIILPVDKQPYLTRGSNEKIAAPLLVLTIVTALSACNGSSPSPKPPVPPAPTTHADGIYIDNGQFNPKAEKVQLLIGGYMFEYTETTETQVIRHMLPEMEKVAGERIFSSEANIKQRGSGQEHKPTLEYTASNHKGELTVENIHSASVFHKMKSVWPQHETTFFIETPDFTSEVIINGSKLIDPQNKSTVELSKLKNGEFRRYQSHGVDYICGVWIDPDTSLQKLVISNFKNAKKGDIFDIYTEKQ
ncbi:hypothetical protein Sps_00906 [Shewanella psychrophila]|uniref:Lipoprotein n=1 Tax=Shewanella psychrophila TaxID=225848 RepID=A0A1S6HKS4_9GAMM|nr:hypothetical protein [Shewanella psychrophila]AQS36098.1 hypothetical protein Sps_00906 [Shewanella psychrophila]